MAKEIAAIIRQKNGDFDHYIDNHPRCFCHVLALILGAGLRSLKLQNQIQPPKSKPDFFPELETIEEVVEPDGVYVDLTEDVDVQPQEINDLDDRDEVDPDDASEGELSEDDQDKTPTDPTDKASKTGSTAGGIGHTLVKVDYISRRICSSTAKRAEFKLVSQKIGYKGPQLIPGYGIRWNVAYDSWTRAYAARKVIVQLLNDESDKYAGKSTAGHFFKGYEVSNKEWQDLNSLNQVLEEFLATTLRMEGDGTSSAMVLYEYSRLISFLETRKKSPEFSVLLPMFDPMIKVANKYLNLALRCHAILLATMFHPAWRLSLIRDKFPEHFEIAEGILTRAFQAKLHDHQKSNPPPTTDLSHVEDSEDDEFNYYPEKKGASQEIDELKKYKDGAWPLSKKADPLSWWKAHASEFPQLALVARDVLACAGSSATVERTFSAAADVCAPVRSSLAAETIERCVSSHMWLRSGIKAGGEFADPQRVIDAAESNKKFSTQLAKIDNSSKCHKIKHVASNKNK
ncbi:hypothetical protein PGT21_002316 [Puccinia graminis f. sp. tritici]|uniref:HAT C-terminal dimerisation domain-containing protein n=1 Tax=Puccinia graminis f. sp. tritici TaxID=56615 RepID=A0A5B0Q1N0_PUCGR|nr:hypothetical protein PGT21_002316 [Puccinia graminis f. sp. tritici]